MILKKKKSTGMESIYPGIGKKSKLPFNREWKGWEEKKERREYSLTLKFQMLPALSACPVSAS